MCALGFSRTDGDRRLASPNRNCPTGGVSRNDCAISIPHWHTNTLQSPTLQERNEPSQLKPGMSDDVSTQADRENLCGRDTQTPQDLEEYTPGVIRSGKLAGKTLWAGIWILALPVLLQQTMQACVGLVDKILAGNLPSDIVTPAMDGLGIGSYIGWFIGIAMAGLGIGGQAVIARAMGRGDIAEGEHALGQAITLSVMWGVLVGVVLWVMSPPLAEFCGLTSQAKAYCVEYIRTLALSMPLCGIMMVGAMCLHGAGETTKPSMIAIAVNMVNIMMSWILSGADLEYAGWVIRNPFDFDLHVIGIAAGTATSYAIGALLTVWVLRSGVKDLQLKREMLGMRQAMTHRILRVGLPNFFEGISMWAVNLFVLYFIGVIATESSAGEGLVGAHVIAVQWEAFSFMPGFAIGTAAGALAGQYLGAGNPLMAKKAVTTCTGLAVVVMVTLGLVFIFGGELLTRIVSKEEIHLRHTPNLLAICGVMQLFFAITMVVRQGLRGVGDTTWTFLITTASSYGVRLPAAYVLGVMMGLGIEGIWIALCGELAVRACLFSARFMHGGWTKLEV